MEIVAFLCYPCRHRFFNCISQFFNYVVNDFFVYLYDDEINLPAYLIICKLICRVFGVLLICWWPKWSALVVNKIYEQIILRKMMYIKPKQERQVSKSALHWHKSICSVIWQQSLKNWAVYSDEKVIFKNAQYILESKGIIQ